MLERSAQSFFSRKRLDSRAYTEKANMEPKRAKVLTPAKFRHLLRVTEATSRFPERDTLILLLGVTCGTRITDIARIEVGDVLAKSGVRREEVSLRGSITKGCRSRCIYLSHVRSIDVLDRYIEWRYGRSAGAALDRREYRGLMSRTRLILTQKGGPFELSVQRRVNFDGETSRISGGRQPPKLCHRPVPLGRPRGRL